MVQPFSAKDSTKGLFATSFAFSKFLNFSVKLKLHAVKSIDIIDVQITPDRQIVTAKISAQTIFELSNPEALANAPLIRTQLSEIAFICGHSNEKWQRQPKHGKFHQRTNSNLSTACSATSRQHALKPLKRSLVFNPWRAALDSCVA